MVWVPGTDYPPAQQHVGYPVSVLADRTDTGAVPLDDGARVVGWRAGCDCGWRGRQFYPRAEWPSATGAVPTAVEGWEGATATCGEWVRHVQQAVPELPVYELARQLTDIRATLTEAVTVARRAGLSWAQIGDAGSAQTTRPVAGVEAGSEASIHRSRDALTAHPVLTSGRRGRCEMDRSAEPTQQLYRVSDVMRLLALSRSVIYEQIRIGRLKSVSQGRTRLIPAAAIADYVALLQREADDGPA